MHESFLGTPSTVETTPTAEIVGLFEDATPKGRQFQFEYSLPPGRLIFFPHNKEKMNNLFGSIHFRPNPEATAAEISIYHLWEVEGVTHITQSTTEKLSHVDRTKLTFKDEPELDASQQLELIEKLRTMQPKQK